MKTPAPSPIISPEKIIAGFTQDISALLLQVHSQAPPGKHARLLFVPENLSSAVLSDEKIAGHPGVTKMCNNGFSSEVVFASFEYDPH